MDINTKSLMFYDKPKQFAIVLASQRLLRRLDEVHLLDSSGNIIMSNVVDSSKIFVPPPDEAFTRSLNERPIRIIDSRTNRTSALVKLNNFIDTYLYIVKFMDPKLISYLEQTNAAVSFYYKCSRKKNRNKNYICYYLFINCFIITFSFYHYINKFCF